MPIKRPQLINNEIYHIVGRGVEKRIIYACDRDYLRFVHDLFEFNDENTVLSSFRSNAIRAPNATGSDPVALGRLRKARNLLVKILGFCLMPNHFHLILLQLKDGGISEFMKKVNGGYASYFNKQYNRVGHLFQGKFRAVHVIDEEQLSNVFIYVHVNPAELIEPGWKENGIKNSSEAMEFLEKYRWSSYSDYIGRKNFPSLTDRNPFNQIFEGETGCKNFVKSWIYHKAEIKNLGAVVLE